MSLLAKLIKNNWFVFVLLVGLIFIIYVNSLGNGLVTDDQGLVKEGSKLLTWGRIFKDYSAPLRTMVYSLVYLVAGVTPWVLRLTNIFFHLGSTFLVFLVISKLVNRQVGLLTAVIFAVHPLLSETVVWISAGGYSQYAFFFLLSLYFYIQTTSRKWFFFTVNNRGHYILSIVFYVLALLSLNRALVLGLVFPLYEISFASRTGGLKKNWRKVLPFLLLSGIWVLTFLGALGSRAVSLEQIYYKDGYFYNPLIQWPLAIGSYLGLLVWPLHLTYVHTNNQDTLTYIFRILVLLGFFFSLIWGYRKNKVVFFGLGLFLISLLPSLTPLKIAFIVAERYVYLGSMGIIMVAAYFIIQLWKKQSLRVFIVGGLIIVLLGFMVRTMIRNTDWKDDHTLWAKTAEVSTDSSQAHLNSGVDYGKAGDYVRAEQEFVKAIQINPKIAEYYFNLGVLYLKTSRKTQAHNAFTKALSLKPDYPDAQKGLDLSSK